MPSPIGLYLKGGAGRYTSGYAPYTAVGPTWGAGLLVQPMPFFGAEIGYEGGHHLTQGALFSLLPTQPGILRSGATALLKLTAPIGWFRPFIGAGFGVSWLTPTGTGSDFLSSRFIQEVPLAGGLEFAAGGLFLGARFTYRFLFNSNFIQDPSRSNISGALADIQGTVAYQF
ncbi:MAG: hypothetical protein ACKVPX_09590 [Myxococcaceae bacterium]